MSRVVGYIARSPLSLSRMLFRTQDGKVVYRASHGKCWPFPKSGEQTLMEGIPRNHEIFDPLDFLAQVTQHIPNKGEHQIRCYGWYSNKLRGMRAKAQQALAVRPRRHLTPEQLKRCLTWASVGIAYQVGVRSRSPALSQLWGDDEDGGHDRRGPSAGRRSEDSHCRS